MLKIYDKAQWHIDAGIDSENVIARFNTVMAFLAQNELLASEGIEIIELGIDSSISIHERMLNDKGNKFMEERYDNVINLSVEKMQEALEKEYISFMNEY